MARCGAWLGRGERVAWAERHEPVDLCEVCAIRGRRWPNMWTRAVVAPSLRHGTRTCSRRRWPRASWSRGRRSPHRVAGSASSWAAAMGGTERPEQEEVGKQGAAAIAHDWHRLAPPPDHHGGGGGGGSEREATQRRSAGRGRSGGAAEAMARRPDGGEGGAGGHDDEAMEAIPAATRSLSSRRIRRRRGGGVGGLTRRGGAGGEATR
jgi:hypothetical protein